VVRTNVEIGNELVERIRREFPDIDAARAHRIVKIFAEHMREIIKKVNGKREPNTGKTQIRLGSLMAPRD
jgi:hypothetical protein